MDSAPPPRATPWPPADRRALLEERSMLGDLVHELNNLLGVLEVNQSILEADLKEGRPREDLEEGLLLTRDALERLKAVVSTTRELVDERDVSTLEQVDLSEMMRGLAHPTIPGLEVRIDSPSAVVMGDKERLRLLLAELLWWVAERRGSVLATVSGRAVGQPISVGELRATVRIQTPGRAADRDLLNVALKRHFRGGAEARSGRLGLSVAGALAHNSSASLLAGRDITEDTWVEVRLPVVETD